MRRERRLKIQFRGGVGGRGTEKDNQESEGRHRERGLTGIEYGLKIQEAKVMRSLGLGSGGALLALGA